MTPLELKHAINQLDLKDKWDNCKINSDKLKQKLGGTSETGAFIGIEGLSYGGHWFYVSKDKKYVVDLVLHNQKDIYNKVKGCEIMKGIFKKECYFKNLNING